MQPAKSAEVHQLHGTVPQEPKKTYRPVESYLKPSRPKFPKGLTYGGRRVFKMLCGLLEKRDALTAGDVEALRLFCVLRERHAKAQKHLEDEGEVCAYTRLDSNGVAHEQFKKNLYLEIAQRTEAQMLAILVQLGLTPKSKDTVKPTKSDKPSEVSLVDSYLAFGERKKATVTPINKPVSPAEMLAAEPEPLEPSDEPTERS